MQGLTLIVQFIWVGPPIIRGIMMKALFAFAARPAKLRFCLPMKLLDFQTTDVPKEGKERQSEDDA